MSCEIVRASVWACALREYIRTYRLASRCTIPQVANTGKLWILALWEQEVVMRDQKSNCDNREQKMKSGTGTGARGTEMGT